MSDYISREEALNFEISVECKPERLEAVMEGMAIYGEYLKGLQVVDAVPVVHGRWKPWDLTFGRSVYACSVCGEGENVPTVMGKPMFPYCPNCGAKMDGGDHNAAD